MKAYGFFLGCLLLLTLLSYLFVDPNFFPLKKIYTGFAFNNRELTSVFYFLLVCSLFLGYLSIIRAHLKTKISKKNILMIVGISCLLLLFSYPAMLSYDIFNYITTAKIAFHYLENPYLVMPVEFIGDSNLLFTHAANKYALYGPSWILLTAVPYLLSFKNILLSIVGFKLLNLIFFSGTLYLIFKLSQKTLPVLLFGLNPLVLIETLLSSHNDIALIFFALLAFYFLSGDQKILSFVSLITSILIKFATIFLVPVYTFVYFKKKRLEKLNFDTIFIYSSYSMIAIFFLSAFREEIYPWYAIWFLAFAFLSKDKFLHGISLVLSFFLMLRYLPYMYLGTHFGITPSVKIAVTFVPVLLFVLIFRAIRERYSLIEK